ncbi:acyltransferase family protein [Sphingomonas sp. SRS2]|uniref:acyltransferase family protein n=1 Tax=Sphingomonas sp. SRS2 TaxID=133190 RepID=UPI000695DDFA|nr:acyltransferase [Sphingomonas sp. SRS2]
MNNAPLVYRPQLDALRTVAVGLVLLSHFWLDELKLGHVGVRLFFVLSGFLITTILLRGISLRDFYTGRVMRLAPALYIALGLAFLLDLYGMRDTWKWHVLQLSNLLFAVRDSWELAWPADHLWSLNVEEQFYLVWPLLILFVSRRWLPHALIAVIAVGPAFRIFCHLRGGGEVAALALPFASFDALGLGAFMAVTGVRMSMPGLVALPLLLLAPFDLFPDSFLYNELVEFGPLLTMAALVQLGWDGRLPLQSPLLVKTGRISYGIYLYHNFVYGTVAELGLEQRGPVLMVTCSLITLGIASLSYIFVERPIRSLRGKLSASSTPTAGPLTEAAK